MDDCVFCHIVRGESPSWKVYETDGADDAYAFLDIFPATEYHTLVIPKEHATNMFVVSEESLVGVMKAVKHVVDLYREKVRIENLQVVCSSGAVAQQEVFHLHVHIVP